VTVDTAVSQPPIAFIDLAAQRRRLGRAVDDAILAVLDHGRYIMGPEVDELEQRLSAYTGAAHALTCASGTDALVLALRALGAGPGDGVLVPTFTFAATAEAVALVGATPVFCDVDEETFNLTPDALRSGLDAALGADLRPRAVIPVDLFGQPADYDAIGEFALEVGIDVVADGAQSFGATWGGRRVGSLARITTTSFFPAKPLGCYGDGGAVFTEDNELADRLRSLRVHGQGSHKYENVRVGLNSRLDTMQAAVLLQKLSIFDDELERRGRVADRYAADLADVVGVPTVRDEATSAWAQYTIVVPGDRDDLAARLKERGVPTAIYYPVPLHQQTAYVDAPRAAGGLEVSERLAGGVLSLPMHPYLEKDDQQRVISSVVGAGQ
jgi:dTDP-4-amino-4,6-dideoxygalactose transaminase